MPRIHFLNVDEGDCSIIQHCSGNVSVIDVCCARSEVSLYLEAAANLCDSNPCGNFNQKSYPNNPIKYLKNVVGTDTIFRYIQSHPDMDHMDGIKDLFETFDVQNFWDTANNKEMSDESGWGKYRKEDWLFYQKRRKDQSTLFLTSGATGRFYNESADGSSGGDGLYILAPTTELLKLANESGAYNDCSYVILYAIETAQGTKKILFCGDSEDKTWDFLLSRKSKDVSDIDVLIAPHHGRKSGGNDEYLDVLNPKLTLLGNAKSKYLDYSSFNSRGLLHWTNNQAGNTVLDINQTKGSIDIYVSNEKFAKEKKENPNYSKTLNAYFIESF